MSRMQTWSGWVFLRRGIERLDEPLRRPKTGRASLRRSDVNDMVSESLLSF